MLLSLKGVIGQLTFRWWDWAALLQCTGAWQWSHNMDQIVLKLVANRTPNLIAVHHVKRTKIQKSHDTF